jgi:hypothetical protein
VLRQCSSGNRRRSTLNARSETVTTKPPFLALPNSCGWILRVKENGVGGNSLTVLRLAKAICCARRTVGPMEKS